MSDKAYHEIFEILFNTIKIESSTYAKAKTASQKNAASRVSGCANVLRGLVTVACQKLRPKTIKALLDHLTQTVPTDDGAYFEPLASDYFKTLRTILGYPSHVEHLGHEEWHDLTDFCIQVIKDLGHSPNEETVDSPSKQEILRSSRGRLSRSTTPLVRLPSSSGLSNGNNSRLSKDDNRSKPFGEDVTLCLKHLASASNKPVLDKASIIVDALLGSDLLSTHSDLVRQAAFETINMILSRVHANDVTLSLRAVEALIPIIRRSWSTRLASLKEHMLVPLILGEPYLAHLMVSDSDDTRAELLTLLDTTREEYCRRHERDQLHVSILDLTDAGRGYTKERPLGIQAFRLQFGALEAESAWCLIHVTASIVVTFSGHLGAGAEHPSPVEAKPTTKKRKTDNPVDSLFHHLRLSALPEKIYSLQVLCFVFEMIQLEPSILQGHIETLLQHVSDKSSSLCSWTMLALTRYARSLPVKVVTALTSTQRRRTNGCTQLPCQLIMDSGMASCRTPSHIEHDL